MSNEVQQLQFDLVMKFVWKQKKLCFETVVHVYTPSQWGSPGKKPACLQWLWQLSFSRGPVQSSATVQCAACKTKITFIQLQYKRDSGAAAQCVVNHKGKYSFNI